MLNETEGKPESVCRLRSWSNNDVAAAACSILRVRFDFDLEYIYKKITNSPPQNPDRGNQPAAMARIRRSRRGVCPTSGDGGVDRLSALPDDLLRLILGRLDTRTKLSTAVLARRWARLPRGLHALQLRVGDVLPRRYHRALATRRRSRATEYDATAAAAGGAAPPVLPLRREGEAAGDQRAQLAAQGARRGQLLVPGDRAAHAADAGAAGVPDQHRGAPVRRRPAAGARKPGFLEAELRRRRARCARLLPRECAYRRQPRRPVHGAEAVDRAATARHEAVGTEEAPRRRGAAVVGRHVAAAPPAGRAVAGGPAHPRGPSRGGSSIVATWARDRLAVAAIEGVPAPSSQRGRSRRVPANAAADFLGEIPG